MISHEDAVKAFAAAAITWRTASFSGENACVEVAVVPGYIGLRDAKLGSDSPILAFTSEEWACFVAGVRAGEFDLRAFE